MSRRGRWPGADGKLIVPEGYESADDPIATLRETSIEANYEHVGTNLSNTVDTSGVRIGIADTASSPPEEFYGDVGTCIDCRPERVQQMEHDPLHGHSVARIVQRASPDATYNFYQAIPGMDDAANEYRVGDLIPAIERAVSDSVDILNVSAGVDGKYSSELSYERAVTTAVEAGVTIVAAAGNRDRVDRLCYPARADSVVAVGGCLVRCRGPDLDGHLKDSRIWTGSPKSHDGPYCSAHGCTRRTGCKEARKQRAWWTGNVEPHGEKPSVAAPCYSILHEGYLEESKEGRGTSFAAPIVTGSLARLIAAGDSRYEGEELSRFLRAEGTDLGVDHERQYQRVMFRNPE